MQLPPCAGSEHSWTPTFSGCPAGGYVKGGKLTLFAAPGGSVSTVFVLQPLLFIKSSDISPSIKWVTVSSTARAMDWKVTVPLFVRSICTYQALPVQLIVPLYDAVKLGIPGVMAVAGVVTVAGVLAVAGGLGVRVAGGLGVFVGGLRVRVAVGLGGDVNTGKAPTIPVTLAYLPDNQQS